jgi:biotin operon repressor
VNYRACAWLRRKLKASDLNSGARAVALLIATHTNANGRTDTPITNKTLGDVLGYSVKHVWRCTAELRDAGVIVLETSGQAGNTYRIPYGEVIHTPRVDAGGTHRVDATDPPRGRDHTYIRNVGTSARVCDSCGCPVDDPARWRHAECPPPPIAAAGGEP